MANEIESPVGSAAVNPTVPAETKTHANDLSKTDALLAVVAGLAAFGLYLATQYPGLSDIGDASKFAFVGRALGIPHAPGYPLYVLGLARVFVPALGDARLPDERPVGPFRRDLLSRLAMC